MAAALRDLRQAGADGAPDAQQVDLDDPLEEVRVHGQRGRHVRRDARVGHDHVEAAEARDRRLDGAGDGLAVGNVGGEPERALGVERVRRLEVHERDRGAARVERPRGRGADPARRAGDQRDLAIQRVAAHGVTQSG